MRGGEKNRNPTRVFFSFYAIFSSLDSVGLVSSSLLFALPSRERRDERIKKKKVEEILRASF